ncbi:MAG: 2-oxoacid:acceptor oxidoreductase family protein [Candidatus Margulisiibacteriota bacterium]
MARFEICLSGHGGQGMVLAGKILGQALALYTDKNVVQTQSYGPEARGGSSKSEIIVSDEEINYPKVIKLDLLVALTQESLDKYFSNLKESGILMIDPFRVKSMPKSGRKVYSIPVVQLAKAKLGRSLFANIILLGALAAVTGIVSKESLEKAVLAHVPAMTKDMNIQALAIGFEAGEESKK